MANDAFIRCEGLVKLYRIAGQEVLALQGLDLEIQKGELMGIVGASGSGKSTLMNILGGLDRPSTGRVWVDGQDLLKISPAALNRYRSRKVGFVWQQGARNLIPYLSAFENVRLPITLSGSRGVKSQRRAAELLETVGLSARRGHRLVELSGGEQQRVAIAVALANQPSLLLADEPTGEVDTATAASIFQVFRDLTERFGLTTVIVSHDVAIARYVDRVVRIRDGRTASETIRQDGDHKEMFEEVVLIDSAGRLQIPHDYLSHFNIQGRVKVELTEDGILIVPAPSNGSPADNDGLDEGGELNASAPRETLWTHLRTPGGWRKIFK
jgi:putative ABC transport system ATP-binding protein